MLTQHTCPAGLTALLARYVTVLCCPAAALTKGHCCRYAGGAQSRTSASGVRLVARAKGKPKHTPRVEVPTISPEEEGRQRKAKQLEEKARQQKAAEAAAAAAAKEKDAQRQWILQYAEDDSESDSDGHFEQVSCVNSNYMFSLAGQVTHPAPTEPYSSCHWKC